jgi:hypothetical protein
MSGRTAPARTAIAMPDLARSRRLPERTRPFAASVSIAAAASTTTSTGSPACTRFATSTPPAASVVTGRAVSRR